MVNIVDAIIIVLLLCGIIYGLKKGAVYMAVSLISVILIFCLSYYLKRPLAGFMYSNLPYFDFKGLSSINILFYDSIAFLILLIIFTIVFKIIIKVSDILSKIIDHSVILTLPSKLIGMIIGFLESYILVLIIMFLITSINFHNEIIETSKLSNVILTKTPFTKNIRNSYKAIKKIKKIDDNKTLKIKNAEVINVLLKYDLINEKNVKKIVNSGKIKVDKNYIERYEEKYD